VAAKETGLPRFFYYSPTDLARDRAGRKHGYTVHLPGNQPVIFKEPVTIQGQVTLPGERPKAVGRAVELTHSAGTVSPTCRKIRKKTARARSSNVYINVLARGRALQKTPRLREEHSRFSDAPGQDRESGLGRLRTKITSLGA